MNEGVKEPDGSAALAVLTLPAARGLLRPVSSVVLGFRLLRAIINFVASGKTTLFWRKRKDPRPALYKASVIHNPVGESRSSKEGPASR
jgi:hypothetical protein